MIALIEELQKRGIACDVLSRGFGRTSSGARVVNLEDTAEEFGDEPLLIAKRTGVPVFVGESRYAAGQLAESASDATERIHILDDGFQHRKLARDYDLVLLESDDLEDHLLPEGRLREPVASLLRADALIVKEAIMLSGGAARIPQWRYHRIIDVPRQLSKPIAFCGIARPYRFFNDVKREGIDSAFNLSFRDHHRYTNDDIKRLQSLRSQHGADGFLTTEKDLVRMGSLAQKLAPIFAVRLSIQMEDAAHRIDSMLATIAARRGRS